MQKMKLIFRYFVFIPICFYISYLLANLLFQIVFIKPFSTNHQKYQQNDKFTLDNFVFLEDDIDEFNIFQADFDVTVSRNGSSGKTTTSTKSFKSYDFLIKQLKRELLNNKDLENSGSLQHQLLDRLQSSLIDWERERYIFSRKLDKGVPEITFWDSLHKNFLGKKGRISRNEKLTFDPKEIFYDNHHNFFTMKNDVRTVILYLGILDSKSKSSQRFTKISNPQTTSIEIVQWTDIILTLYTLGYSVILLSDYRKTLQAIKDSFKKEDRDLLKYKTLVFTDMKGYGKLKRQVSSSYYKDELKEYAACRLRVLSNYGYENGHMAKNSSSAPYLDNLHPRQYGTLYPESKNRNSFYGFSMSRMINIAKPKFRFKKVANEQQEKSKDGNEISHDLDNDDTFVDLSNYDDASLPRSFILNNRYNYSKPESMKKKPKMLIHGYNDIFWNSSELFLDTFSDYFEIFSVQTSSRRLQNFTAFPETATTYQNLGQKSLSQFYTLAEESEVIFTVEDLKDDLGYFNLANFGFFLVFLEDSEGQGDAKNHNQNQNQISQKTYLKNAINKPFITTLKNHTNFIEINDLLQTLTNLPAKFRYKSLTTKNYLMPFEFTVLGMIERMFYYVESQDFCGDSSNNEGQGYDSSANKMDMDQADLEYVGDLSDVDIEDDADENPSS